MASEDQEDGKTSQEIELLNTHFRAIEQRLCRREWWEKSKISEVLLKTLLAGEQLCLSAHSPARLYY